MSDLRDRSVERDYLIKLSESGKDDRRDVRIGIDTVRIEHRQTGGSAKEELTVVIRMRHPEAECSSLKEICGGARTGGRSGR